MQHHEEEQQVRGLTPLYFVPHVGPRHLLQEPCLRSAKPSNSSFGWSAVDRLSRGSTQGAPHTFTCAAALVLKPSASCKRVMFKSNQSMCRDRQRLSENGTRDLRQPGQARINHSLKSFCAKMVWFSWKCLSQVTLPIRAHDLVHPLQAILSLML